MPSQERRVTAMTAMTVRLGCPLLQSLLFKVYEEGRFCPSGDSDDSGDGNVGIPFHCHPAGEHPVNAKCRRRIYPPFSACKTTPAVRKILPIFPTAFTGCNTLHFALQSRVPDVPSGLPYGRSYALLILRSTLRIKEWQHDGDGSCEGVFQKHRHHRHDRHAGNKGDS